MKTTFYRKYGKRIFDLVLVIPGVILLSPFFALLSLLLHIRIGKPILFRQYRPGYQSTPYIIFKFRTMTEDRDSNGNLLGDKERLTSLGRFLRSTSLDELPELFNVIKGEMSLIGPRPLLMEYLDLYSAEQMRRMAVKPGITGWAQINGRNNLSWEEKFALDIWYVDNLTFRLDTKILFRTVWQTLMREGINQPGQATVQRFTGNGN